jgi:hypothetical protein
MVLVGVAFRRPPKGTICWRAGRLLCGVVADEQVKQVLRPAHRCCNVRVADDSGVERRFVPAPELPDTLLNGTGYQESKLES